MEIAVADSPLEYFDHYARHTPDAPFLTEDRQTSLSYLESHVLAGNLLPPRLIKFLTNPPSSNSSQVQQRVVLVTPNNALFLLTVLALWRLSYTAVLAPPRAEPDVWMGMISIARPALVIAASSVLERVERCVTEYNAIKNAAVRVVSLESMLPLELLGEDDTVPRASNFIPRCLRWIQVSFPDRALLVATAYRGNPAILPTANALTLFTSSAVDKNTVKGVTYTHRFLVSNAVRSALSLGENPAEFPNKHPRHLGWLPLHHAFEMGISFWSVLNFLAELKPR
jgi:acyl-CoA synthetase (AMP-forming)/AMP-acid ligase II